MPNILWCTQDVNPGYVSSLVNFCPILLISSASLTQYSLDNTYQKLMMIPQEATILYIELIFRASSLRDLESPCLHWKCVFPWGSLSLVCSSEVKEPLPPTPQMFLAPCHNHPFSFMFLCSSLRPIHAVIIHIILLRKPKNPYTPFLHLSLITLTTISTWGFNFINY